MTSLKRTLLRYREQNNLNRKLRRLVEQEGKEASDKITDLLERGGDPNYRDDSRESLIFTVLYNWPYENMAAGIELLTRFGANVNLPGDEGQPPLHWLSQTSYPSELGDLLLSKGAAPLPPGGEGLGKSPQACRFGKANPERTINAYYNYMATTGDCAPSPHRLNSPGGKDPIQAISAELAYGTPSWCNHRYGQTFHFLEDGTLLQIGGEQEDFYDPNFYIHNDVITVAPGGPVQVNLYPEAVLPPTDFHSSTRVGNEIYIIGGLGYRASRIEGQTIVHALNLDNFSIRTVATSGENPGWLHDHTALLDEEENCLYTLHGKQWNDEKLVENTNFYRLDLTNRVWTIVK